MRDGRITYRLSRTGHIIQETKQSLTGDSSSEAWNKDLPTAYA